MERTTKVEEFRQEGILLKVISLLDLRYQSDVPDVISAL
jgi:hypothetical protein